MRTWQTVMQNLAGDLHVAGLASEMVCLVWIMHVFLGIECNGDIDQGVM